MGRGSTEGACYLEPFEPTRRLRPRESKSQRSPYFSSYNGESVHGYSTRSSHKGIGNEKKRPHGGTSDDAEDEGSLDGGHFQNHVDRRSTRATSRPKSASDGEQNFQQSSMYDNVKTEGRRAKKVCIQRLGAQRIDEETDIDLTEEEPQQYEPVKVRKSKTPKAESTAHINGGDHDDSHQREQDEQRPMRITRSHHRVIPIESGSSTEEECNEAQKSPLGKRNSETISPGRQLRARRPARPQFSMPIQNHQRSFRTHRRSHRRPAHNASDSDSSSSEERFQRKKAAKLDKIRDSFLPLNMSRSDLMKGTLNERSKVGSSMADIQPMVIDRSITFESIGGLDNHIDSLKEMVLFPLLYPEIFDKFKVQVPRGVLFYGPPGTGKTLVARALANECSVNGKKIAFFMRKGADCMSKWVGESERQLRCLFDQAHAMRPSIIFFDEIDGIAPVRSTRQDQIHSSIVSTLLALMDGLDSRGEIIVIGATNRIEAIDPALRRPGRFDREFHFPLPNYVARKDIITIHTKNWNPKLDSELIETLAGQTVGYCGADLKALCSEAVLLALKRRYKQIYKCKSKLKIDIDSIAVTKLDFDQAISGKIVPAAQRSVSAFGKPLPVIIRPLLYNQLNEGLEHLKQIFPLLFKFTKDSSSEPADASCNNCQMFDDQLLTNEEVSKLAKQGTYRSIRFPGIFRPRLLISGSKDLGQRYIAAALLHQTDSSNQFKLDATKGSDDLVTWFSEAIKKLPIPSIIFVPSIEDLEPEMFNLLNTLLCELEPTTPLMVLATCQTCQLPAFVQDLFDPTTSTSRHILLQDFTRIQIEHFFTPLILQYTKKPITREVNEELEVLVEEETVVNRKLNERELAKLRKREAISLRQLRNFLRDVLGKVIRDRRFSDFVKPVDKEEVPDYEEVIKNPMNLETMMLKIDTNCYETAGHFLEDIDLITANALEYNPWKDLSSKIIRHKAHALRDFAFTLIENEMDSDFETMCQEMHQNRKERGEVTINSLPAIVAEKSRDDQDGHVDNTDGHTGSTNHNNSNSSNHGNESTLNGQSNSRNRKKGRPPKSKCADNSINDVHSGDLSSTIVNTDSSNDGQANQIDLNMSEEKTAPAEAPASPTTIVNDCPSPQAVRDNEINEAMAVDTEPEQEPVKEAEKEQQTQPEQQPQLETQKPQEPQPEPDLTVKIDESALQQVLTRIGSVCITHGCSLENIENLYWKLFRSISKHLNSVDRSSLIAELNGDIDRFEGHIQLNK